MPNSGDMTWGDFKRLVEEAGVKDDMSIWHIDVTYPKDLRVNVPMPNGLGFTVTE